jgi:hypothetical protein
MLPIGKQSNKKIEKRSIKADRHLYHVEREGSALLINKSLDQSNMTREGLLPMEQCLEAAEKRMVKLGKVCLVL